MENENLSEAPKKQIATSLFKLFVGSLPGSILLAIGSTWLLYHSGLPVAVAETYTPQIWSACLTGGAASTVAGAVGLVKRSLDLTGAKIESQSQSAFELAKKVGAQEQFEKQAREKRNEMKNQGDSKPE